MIEIHLSHQEAIDDPSHPEKTTIKLLVIRMRHEGAKTGFISKCLNLHAYTVTNYLNELQTGKLPATLEDRYYKPTSSLDPFIDCLKCSFRASPVADAKQAVERIESLTGIRLSESQSRRFMKSLGLKLRKTAPIPGKCDHQLQFDFYTREMLPRLEEARLGTRKVLFVDAAHLVLGSFLGSSVPSVEGMRKSTSALPSSFSAASQPDLAMVQKVVALLLTNASLSFCPGRR